MSRKIACSAPIHIVRNIGKLLVNELNTRSEEEVLYRYFTTVVYVLIACIFGFNAEIDSYQRLRDFLLSHIAQEV